MRKRFVRTIEELLAEDPRLMVLLGDIGAFGFRRAIEAHAGRILNVGILEGSSVSLAAGLSMEGFVPVFHTIAPFMVERAFEQLKDDFCYQRVGGNFVSVGASYDYSGLGCTHHAPGDVPALRNLPGMEIVVPGAPAEFDALFRQAYANGRPTYFRLSERVNVAERAVTFGRALRVREGRRATIVAFGPLLDPALAAAETFDVSVLYYTTAAPFDAASLRENCPSRTVLLVEPWYVGSLANEVLAALGDGPVRLRCVGVPRHFLTDYGTPAEHDAAIGLTAEGIQSQLASLLEDGR
jgi:transketolase